MRYSQMLIPTVKEVPADAEVISHQLMIRAGFFRRLASGTYTYLPLGWRSLRKISQIVREEMDKAGAQEILMPIVQPAELWQTTGRDVVFEDILGKFTDRHGRSNILAPTAEEVVTSVVAAEISSYKQLPINLYQINTKFRDEFRPRFGALRSREFIMKDAYSFDATVEGLNESYKKMFDAYCRIFDRCGLKYVTVEADSGGMGGTDTEEFMVPCAAGEDTLVSTEDGSYSANLERAEVDPPAAAGDLDAQRQAAGAIEEVHTPDVGTIDAVCEFLGTKPAEMIKTLIYTDPALLDEAKKDVSREEAKHDGRENISPSSRHTRFIAVLVRGDHEINESKLMATAGTSSMALALDSVVTHVTRAATGFAGPMGLVENGDVDLMIIDHTVAAMAVGVTGANKTDHHVRNVVPGRDFPLDGATVTVADIRNAVEGDTHDGKKLVRSQGIEVGHVFKLGTKYSEILGATFLDESGESHPALMGCYGIGINRIFASAIEVDHDENGCILPISIAPFEVEVVALKIASEPVAAEAGRIYDELQAAGVDVLYDDRDARPGVKFKDADLIGIPLRIVVGDRGLKEGNVEIKARTDEKPTLVPATEAVSRAVEIVSEMKAALEG